MAKLNAGQVRLARLLQMLLALGSGRCPNARSLAKACEVSRRTVYRDLEVLELAGVPIRYRADRQGYELTPGFTFAPPSLDEAEATALVLFARQWDHGEDFGLARAARSGVRKLIQALPSEVRERTRDLAELAGPETDPVPPPSARREVYEAILQSLGRRLQVRIWSSAEDGLTLETTKVSPFRLTFIRPVWRLVGRSSAHRDIRSFSLARVRRALLTDEPYLVPPRLDLDRFLVGGEPQRLTVGPTCVIRVRVGAQSSPEFLEAVGSRAQLIEVTEGGGAILEWEGSSPEIALTWALGLGTDFEVLEPPEARTRLAQLAASLAQIHDDAPPPTPRKFGSRGPAARETSEARGAGG